MKTQKLLVSVLLVTALCAAPIFAAAESENRPSPAPQLTKPSPLTVVHPTGIPNCYKDQVIELAMTIDENGIPHDVTGARALPADLAKVLLPAVSQWTFTPMYQDGKPVTARVVLPIELVEN